MVNINKETGTPGGITLNPDRWFKRGGNSNGDYIVDPLERNIDLKFPANIPVFDEMRTTEGQIGSLLSAATLPIMAAKWRLEGSDVRPKVMKFVEQNIGLAKPGESLVRRRRQGIVWKEHLEQACLFMPFGFMPFEQVYDVADISDELREDFDQDYVLYLRKLAPRLPRTVQQIHVNRDGGLAGITQEPLVERGFEDPTFIGVENLVMYTLKREGADWTGRSILRQAYKHYLINDGLVRLGAQIAERNGMGIPVIEYDPNTWNAEAAEAVGAEFRAGARASLAVPIGSKARLMGVEGSTYDPLPMIKYHDEKIAGSALAMFLTLGHDAGARSLGDTFVDIFTQSVQAIADSIASTFTEHVIRDLVELNFGADEPYPVLVPGTLSENKKITSASLKELVDGGIIKVDDKLEDYVRQSEGLPERDPETAREKAAPPAAAPAAGGVIPAAPVAADAVPVQLSAGHESELTKMMQRIIELRTGDRE
ncbi:portal protein [Arthrobacter phage Jawnski]|uniref:Portal protein n=3 Tax=Jawnskivirus TaxID=3425003 RepID=A0A222Z0M8_9CAUD|nr:portal protein [Arthrobacter phage Brent]YP_009601563.1 portal protein [Arthrobacter phage Jawnski]ALF01214.1 portal protein [Arthrobacter phage Brent]ALY09333.1 portal protein [Arthrobacter phage Jawnski]ASR78112.1 portal protein [Arthrobacter phage Franzy]